MQGGEDPLFREVARVLLEYGFVHSRPPAIPKYKVGFVIAAFEGLQVDWTTIIADCLRSTIASLVEGKKEWTGLAQWLTLLVPPVLAIKPKKRGRPETTPKKATKRRQLLEKHTPGWTAEMQYNSMKGKPSEDRNRRKKLRRDRLRRLAEHKKRWKKVRWYRSR